MASSTLLEKMGYLVYFASPNRTSFETIEEVPHYVDQAVPLMFALALTEQLILLFQRKPTMRINNAAASLSGGIIEELSKIFFRGWFVYGYIYIYENWRLVSLPWNSAWTWCITMIGIDFLYYWAHRACHEVNILWAAHQVHHSSEDYNLTSGLRRSLFQDYINVIFYLPMALMVPPSLYVAHAEFNLLYQFWLHTEVIKSIGPLEYVLNTASHHRVHHGRNRYCVDKNYGGTLIIWDRLFGTFEAEKEEVVYGLTHPLNSFEPFYIQFHHYVHILKMVRQTEGFRNKLSVIFKGPGWAPGLPWLGTKENIPDVRAPVAKYDPFVSQWCRLYVFWHDVILLLGCYSLMRLHNELPSSMVHGLVLFELVSITTIGMLSEGRSYASWLELCRCALFLGLDLFLFPISEIARVSRLPWRYAALAFVRVSYIVSLAGWFKTLFKSIRFKINSHKKFM